MIIIDQITTHDTSNTGDNTVPPGVTGLDWCHLVSTSSLEELQGFLANNFPAIGQSFENIRQPSQTPGSLQTYAGLDPAQRSAAVAAGASPNRVPFVATHSFDATGSGPPYYEP